MRFCSCPNRHAAPFCLGLPSQPRRVYHNGLRGWGPIANVQVPAAYRFKLGGFECTVVSDGPLRLGTFSAETFKGYTQERIDEILADNFLDKNNFVVEQNALVVNTGGKLVLIHTGIGFRQVYGPRSGRFAHQSAGRGWALIRRRST